MSAKKISRFLIFIVFIIYISLGLPDSIMGSAWPSIRQSYHFPVDMIGILGAIQLGFSFCSTLVYPKLAKYWTLDIFILFSTTLTVFGLLALGLGATFFPMLLSCVLLGFGQGSVDIAINDYSAKHFSNSLMNFLHAFYGIGVMASSFIMTYAIQSGSWQLGVWIITLSQFAILLLAFVTRNKFKEKAEITETATETTEKLQLKHFLLPSFYFFYALELIIGRFYSSFAVETLHFSMATGAAITSFYWAGLTVGRFLTGFTARHFSQRSIIYSHLILLIFGSVLCFIPSEIAQYFSGSLLGLGLAPLYPTGMKKAYELYSGPIAQRIISYNIAFATIGMFLLPIPLGWIFEQFSFTFYPLVIVIFTILLGLILVLIYQKKKVSSIKSF
ncbi:sugar MFS transporter [Lactococcus sp.]|uniref:MFS transporter n=1 Tax=Lactococcus sp. TaxID=44273 RepID=UPI0035AE9DBE